MTGDCRQSHSARPKLSEAASFDNVTVSHILQSHLPTVPYKVDRRVVYLCREQMRTYLGNAQSYLAAIFLFQSHAIVTFSHGVIFFLLGQSKNIYTILDGLHVFWPS